MADKVHFTAPTNTADLRVVLQAPSITANDMYGIAYKTQYGETRFLYWMTKDEANRRATALRKRGYRVAAGPMDIAG